MKKFLLISNIVTLSLLIFIGLHYHIPTKIYEKLTTEKAIPQDTVSKAVAELNCSYSLTSYDFHYQQECDTPNIIMFGNSIVRHGKWTELLNRNDVINRGIAGDNLPCMCERLTYLKGKNADIWFIEGGINDLPMNTPQSILERYIEIVEFVKSENAIPVINLVFYLSPKVGEKFSWRSDYKSINNLVAELNVMLVDYATKNNIEYIDLNSIIADNDNVLKDEFTTDGIHLNENGYKEWTKLISKVLIKNKI